jgi:LmbE family N-acetylglucosaminyl deacetylase
MSEYPYELIVTHNPQGEYGHPQHRALHRIVRRIARDHPLYVFGTAWFGRRGISAAKE